MSAPPSFKKQPNQPRRTPQRRGGATVPPRSKRWRWVLLVVMVSLVLLAYLLLAFAETRADRNMPPAAELVTTASHDGAAADEATEQRDIVTQALTTDQGRLLSDAVQYRIAARNNLNTLALDGYRKIFDRSKIEYYLHQLDGLPHTQAVADARAELRALHTGYYQNGYPKDKYELLSHRVSPGETPAYIAARYGVTVAELQQYNPREVTEGAIKTYEGQWPRIFIFRKRNLPSQ